LPLLQWLNKHRDVLGWFRSAVTTHKELRVDSKDELEHLVAGSRHILSDSEIKLIIASLSFDDKLVREVMTPKSVVETIKRGEILGPLTLDDLHKTGHSRFPVIDEDIDHVVGILHIKSVLTLDTSKKHTSKVESAMSKDVHYIRDDHNLSQALSGFLSTHNHLFIVINEFRETVGIITLEDTLEVLLGRRIVDEFDAHDDMRAVAARQAASHRAPGSTDV
jgi:magnesium and cobalt transporter